MCKAPWLSWLKRLSSKQEIPSSNLGGASFLYVIYSIHIIRRLSSYVKLIYSFGLKPNSSKYLFSSKTPKREKRIFYFTCYFSGRTEFQAAVSASLGRDRSISFERRPSHRYPRRGKINSNRASTGTIAARF